MTIKVEVFSSPGCGKCGHAKDVLKTIATERALADLASAEKALARYEKPARAGDKEAQKMAAALKPVLAALNEGRPARAAGLDAEALAVIKPLCLMTVKPTFYVANVSEDGFHDNPMLDALKAFADKEGAPVVPVCAALEAELQELSPQDRLEYLKELGWDEPGLNRLIRAAYDLLGLQTYFTAGVKEVRAWTIKKGATGPQAAGAIVVRQDMPLETRYRLIGIHMPMHLENKAAFAWAASWLPKAAEFEPTEAQSLLVTP